MNPRFSEIIYKVLFGTSPPLRKTYALANLYRAVFARTRIGLRGHFRVVDARVIPRTESLSYANLGKVLQTAVLYVDIRGSTELHTYTDQVTVARILKAFLGEMAQVARRYSAYIRGFAGDRIMVVTEQGPEAATTALEIAISMRDVVRSILNPAFVQNLGRTISVGFGIDHGTLLAIKVGMQREPEHSDLVWVGTPANVASKITDAANPNEILISSTTYTLLDQSAYPSNLWTARQLQIAGQQVLVYALAAHVSFGEALAQAGLT